jgi:hypothetical protein
MRSGVELGRHERESLAEAARLPNGRNPLVTMIRWHHLPGDDDRDKVLRHTAVLAPDLTSNRVDRKAEQFGELHLSKPGILCTTMPRLVVHSPAP